MSFVLVHWSTGSLPWMSMLSNPVNVQSAKEKFLSSIQKNSEVSPELKQLICAVQALSYEAKPDYVVIRKFFSNGFKRLKVKSSGKLIFNQTPSSVTKASVESVDLAIDFIDNSESAINKSRAEKNVSKRTDMVGDAKGVPRVGKFTPAAVDNLNSNVTPSDGLKAAAGGMFNNLDRQVQTSPWLYEKYREERRKRRREANGK